MADIKTKGSMDKPKVKTSGVVPKEAASIIKEKYQEQQERNAPGQKDSGRREPQVTPSSRGPKRNLSSSASRKERKAEIPGRINPNRRPSYLPSLHLLCPTRPVKQPSKTSQAPSNQHHRLTLLWIRTWLMHIAKETQRLLLNTMGETYPQIQPGFSQRIVQIQM